MLSGAFDYGFAIGLMCKDSRPFAVDAEDLGVPLWVGAAVRQPWQFSCDQLGSA